MKESVRQKIDICLAGIVICAMLFIVYGILCWVIVSILVGFDAEESITLLEAYKNIIMFFINLARHVV